MKMELSKNLKDDVLIGVACYPGGEGEWGDVLVFGDLCKLATMIKT